VTKTSKPFQIKSLVYPVFLPSFLFSVGEAGLIPVIPASAEALGADIPTAGIIAGLGMLGTLFADIPAVKFVNFLGERKAMILASILAATAILLAVFATNIWMLSVGIFVTGACHAVFGLARHGFIAEVVPIEKRGRALAILGGTFRGGGFVGPLIGALLIAAWGVSSVYWMPVIFGLLAGFVLLTTKPGALADTPPNQGYSIFFIAKREGVKLRTLGLAATSLAIARTARTIGLPLWALYIHLPVQTAALYIGIAGALDFALFYSSGQLVDRFGRRWAAMPTLTGMALSLFALTLAQDSTGFLIVALALSLSNALGSGLVMVIGADLAPKDARNEFLAFYRLMIDGGVALTAPAIALMTIAFGLPLAIAGIGVITLGGAIGMWRHIPRFEIN
jgi:predicted MFS family arabinose efflux permease